MSLIDFSFSLYISFVKHIMNECNFSLNSGLYCIETNDGESFIASCQYHMVVIALANWFFPPDKASKFVLKILGHPDFPHSLCTWVLGFSFFLKN